MKLLIASLLVLGACSDLPLLEGGVCGNFVIDRDEDCDGEASCDAECRLQCVSGACAIDGYSCGVDGFCRAPSGVFGRVSGTLSLSTAKYEVSDIDQNGIPDVVAMSPTSVTVNYGDPDGLLAFQTSTLTPTVQGPPLFANLDVDASLDVIIPTEDGIVAYSSPSGVLAPHPFSINLADTSSQCQMQIGSPFHVFAADDRHLAAVFLLPPSAPNVADGRIGIAIIDTQGKDSCPSQVPQILCSNISAVNPAWIDSYDITDPLTPDQRHTLVAVSTPQGLCAMDVQARLPLIDRKFTVSAVTGAPYPPVQGRPLLADLTSSGCPSVVDSSLGATAMTLYAGTRSAGRCSIDPTGVPLQRAAGYDPVELTGQVVAVGRIELSPPVANAAKDALVMESGVYVVNPTTRRIFDRMYLSDRRLGAVRMGDVDDDGDLDGIAVTGQTDDIDVLYRRDDNSGLTTGFLRFRVDTRGTVTNLVVGDFDGNEVDDIAYTEILQGGSRLLLAYGTRDRVLDPTEAGAFRSVVGLVPMQASDSTDPFNVIDDLVILDVPLDAGDPTGPLDDIQPVFTLLHGSPQRTMLSFFDPRLTGDRDSAFTGIAAYYPNASQPLRNLLAVEVKRIGSPRIWPISNQLGVLTSSPAQSSPSLADCRKQVATTDGNVNRFCTETASYLPWWIGTRDLLIATQRLAPNRMVVVDPAGQAVVPVTLFDGSEFSNLAVRSMHAVDTDGDLDKELVISFGAVRDEVIVGMPVPELTAGTVQVCEVSSGTARPTSCQDLTSITPELTNWTCEDASPGTITPFVRFGPPPPLGAALAVVCRRGTTSTVFRVQREESGFHATAMWTDADAGTIERIKVGDVTGDGLQELLLIKTNDSDPSKFLVIVPHCASSDRACIEGPNAVSPAMGSK